MAKSIDTKNSTGKPILLLRAVQNSPLEDLLKVLAQPPRHDIKKLLGKREFQGVGIEQLGHRAHLDNDRSPVVCWFSVVIVRNGYEVPIDANRYADPNLVHLALLKHPTRSMDVLVLGE